VWIIFYLKKKDGDGFKEGVFKAKGVQSLANSSRGAAIADAG
jgi:hypothetical protein